MPASVKMPLHAPPRLRGEVAELVFGQVRLLTMDAAQDLLRLV